MSVAVTTTAEELRLDILTRDLLGSEGGGNVEALLAANPGLAAGGAFVPAGTRLVVPDVPRPASRLLPSINPWE